MAEHAVGSPRSHREVHTIDRLRALLDSTAPLQGLRIQDLDITEFAAHLAAREDVHGLVVLGGTVPEDLAQHLRRNGAIVFPADPAAPINIYRPHLYAPEDLYDRLSSSYAETTDARAYAWARDTRHHGDAYVTLLRAIHDDSMNDALDEALEGRDVVGIMGGHAVERTSASYAVTARLGHELADRGLVVATGGGPGAMEAANLGASARHTGVLDEAIVRLSAVPSFRPRIDDWARLAMEVRHTAVPPSGAPIRSIGIPTWFYGHEPPNVFCDGIAKFFSNALREDGLLARCTAGVVVMPGAAGTVQEIFQAVTPMFYASAGDAASTRRLVLVGVDHWTEQVPAWPVLRALAAGRAMADHIHLVDDPHEAISLLVG